MDKTYYDLQDRIGRAILWIDALQRQNSIVQKNMDKKSAQKITQNNEIKIQRLQRLIKKTEQDLDLYQLKKIHNCRIMLTKDQEYLINDSGIVGKKTEQGWIYLGSDPDNRPGPVA